MAREVVQTKTESGIDAHTVTELLEDLAAKHNYAAAGGTSVVFDWDFSMVEVDLDGEGVNHVKFVITVEGSHVDG